MTDSLSARAYASAVRMHQNHPTMTKPKPEDYVHLDVGQPAAPPPEPPPASTPALSVVPGTPDDAAVRAALVRMQEATRTIFAPPPQDAA
jgi:hypothetical protein